MSKKIIELIIGVLLLFSLAACNTSKESRMGSFYSLNNLYENKRITENDLLNIAYRNNGGLLYNIQGEELLVIPEAIVQIEDLNQEMKDMIISDYFDMLIEDEYFIDEKLKISDIEIIGYFGIYSGYYAIRFKDNKILATVSGEENIGGLKFIYPYAGGNTVILWKKNK